MAKILYFEDFLSNRELSNLMTWAEREFPVPDKPNKKNMPEPTYVLVCEREGKSIESRTGITRREIVENFVECLNKKFPERHYYFKTEFPKLKEAKVNQ